MKTIGLIGGMSWESSVHYYATLNKETARRLGGLHSAPIILHSLDFAPIAQLQTEGNWQRAAAILCDTAVGLERAGAEILGIATNTMHMVATEVQDAVNIPLVHIAGPTGQRLLEDGFKHVGLLGTQFTMEMDFYTDTLKDMGLSPIVPDVGITNLNAIIYDELCRGIIRESSRRTYTVAIERLQMRGAEAIILGCTEIAMLINDDHSALPTYDTTELHAKALVAAALQ